MNELTKFNNPNLITSIDDVKSMAELMAKTGVFGGNPGNALVQVLAGRELGIGAYAAMTSINLINGRPSMSANLLAAKVKSSGKYNYRVLELTDQICRLAWYENGQKIGENKFDRNDAKRAGTKNMDRFPENMLFARAISNGVRFHCPDIFYGISVYVPGELDDDESTDEHARVLDQNNDAEYRVEGEIVEIAEAPVMDEALEAKVTAKPELQRPYAPEVFRDKFRAMAQQTALKNHLDAIGDKERKLIVEALDGVLPGHEARVRTLEWLTGKGDLPEIGKHYLKALCRVMDISETNPAPSGVSMVEIKGIYEYLVMGDER